MVGITGGIASYKAAFLVSQLVQKGADVHVIMTESAKKFITELTLQSVSKNRVYYSTFHEEDASVISHIHLADLADLILIAPATANTIAKMAHGLADDMLSTTLLATKAPIMICPAMNGNMYDHPATVNNLALLATRGIHIIKPSEGLLACGHVGIGRLEEPETIINIIEHYFQTQRGYDGEHVACARRVLCQKKVLITAGATVERIDPVRYITNDSSGKMGLAIAEVARDLGANVRLVVGNTYESLPFGVDVTRVQSALQMYEAVLSASPDADIVIKTAAVADYRPNEQADQKIKKKDERCTLELIRNVDILHELGKRKKKQFLVGFAAETENVQEHAQQKLRTKNCDLMVANDVTDPEAGFHKSTNKVFILDKGGLVTELPVQPKKDIALQLLMIVADRIARGK